MSSGLTSNQPKTPVTTIKGTAYRLIYLDSAGKATELSFGTSGYVLASAGASAAPTWAPAAGGTPGSIWRTGAGVPSNGTGVDGDLYLRTSNGDVYQRASGTYGVVANIIGPTGTTGSTGSAGAAGAVWRTGSGVPSNGTGIDGDLYLRTSNSDVYQRASGTYSVVANIAGATGATGSTGSTGSAGAAGSVWRSGSGVPSNGTGVDGDLYLRTSNGDVYQRASGTYSVIVNIVGPTAPTMVASGGSHAGGSVPDPGSSAGSTKFLCENATWAVPAGGGGGTFDQVEVWCF